MLTNIATGARNVWGKVKETGREIVSKVNALTIVAAVSAVSLAKSLCGQAFAADTITLPDMPIDFADLATKGMITVGVVLGALAGIVIVVALCIMGLRKLSGAFSGKA